MPKYDPDPTATIPTSVFYLQSLYVRAVKDMSRIHQAGRLSPDAAALVLGPFWFNLGYPERALTHEQWRSLFHHAGYTVDGIRAKRPTRPMRLFRGSAKEYRTNWSWTPNRRVAEFVAGDVPAGAMWTASVEPWRLLAHNSFPDGHEYIVDTDGLRIESVETWEATK